MKTCRLLLFDLDGTLLRSDKTISPRTLSVLRSCREKGRLLGVSTSRSEQNALSFIRELQPDILIASGGALVKRGGEYLYLAEFSEEETKRMIDAARQVCGDECEITIDTLDAHYWNYKTDPRKQDRSWGDSIYTDFEDFRERSLKMCVEIFDEKRAGQLQAMLADCDCVRFSDGYWYKFTKKTATKERAILETCAVCGIKSEEIIAFGDDYADIGMLELCGRGIAMGNAIEEVKNRADMVIGSNDEDGIAVYLEKAGQFQYLLFDLDGTLTDPKLGITSCVQYALRKFGIEEPSLDRLEPFIGPPLADSFQEFYGFDEQKAAEAIRYYRERFSTVGLFENEIYPGIAEMLAHLKKSGKTLAVASSKPTVFVKKILEHFEIDCYFNVIVGSELDGTRARKEEVVEEALRQLRQVAEIKGNDGIVMIGDRRFDVQGAKLSGLVSVGVSFGYALPGELEEAGADYIVDTVAELEELLNG